MTLSFHEHCRTRLIQALASALSKFRVEHGKYIARSDALAELEAAEKVLPTSGELHTRLGQYIDYDRPLTEFILDTLSDELSRFPFTDVENQQLTEIAGYADSDAVAQRLLERLIELPNKYTLSFRLNVLLRNRCAYLIGNSQEDRAELLEWFRKIYDVRSQIVHSGKHWLSASEFELFARLRWICRRVIRKEIDLLQADEKNR